MKEYWWIVEHPVFHHFWTFATESEATQAAITMNHNDPTHPAFWLIKTERDTGFTERVGRLWRRFGFDFDPKDCWRGELHRSDRYASV